MADIYWGVDSVAPANSVMTAVKGKPRFFDFIAEREKQVPTFFGRYLRGDPKQVLTIPEAKYLLSNNCRILPILHGIPKAGFMKGQGGYMAGRAQGEEAIKHARSLGIPSNVFLYADIEPAWPVTAEWIEGWWAAFHLSEYGGVGGFYCNPTKFDMEIFNNAYKKAFLGKNHPLGIDRLCNLYAQEHPSKACSANPGFAPAAPDCHKDGSVIWQYAVACYQSPFHYDQNLANQRGFDGMWKP